ncbi:MAG: hypothetical protein IJO33_04090 [Bacilli bacterium]|nr:hypothetical protein [Bacilli bacterium]
MDLREFIDNLQCLNPNIKIITNLENDESDLKTIYCDCPLFELILPDDFIIDNEVILNKFYMDDNLTLIKIKVEPLEKFQDSNIKTNFIFDDLENDVENTKGWAVLCGLYAVFAVLISSLIYEDNKQIVLDNYETILSNPQFISITGKISLLLALKNILSYYEKLKKLDRLKNPNSKYVNTTKDLIRLSRKYTSTKKEK